VVPALRRLSPQVPAAAPSSGRGFQQQRRQRQEIAEESVAIVGADGAGRVAEPAARGRPRREAGHAAGERPLPAPTGQFVRIGEESGIGEKTQEPHAPAVVEFR